MLFPTLDRKPFLDSKELRTRVWQHITENARQKGIFVEQVNGYTDHCHCLISLGYDQNIQKIVQLIKGESSHWINKNNLTAEKFNWQAGYIAVSVSESMIEEVRNYIIQQEKHHLKKSFSEEYPALSDKFHFRDDRNNFG